MLNDAADEVAAPEQARGMLHATLTEHSANPRRRDGRAALVEQIHTDDLESVSTSQLSERTHGTRPARAKTEVRAHDDDVEVHEPTQGLPHEPLVRQRRELRREVKRNNPVNALD